MALLITAAVLKCFKSSLQYRPICELAIRWCRYNLQGILVSCTCVLQDLEDECIELASHTSEGFASTMTCSN